MTYDPLIKSFVVILDSYDSDKIRSEFEALEDALHLSTTQAGTFSRPLAMRAANDCPQNYTRAVKLAESVRRVQSREETRVSNHQADILYSARSECITETGNKKPTETAVRACARRRFRKQWSATESTLADCRAATAIVDGLVRAWRDRESTLRRLLDERA
jgi:hypothetical protein